MEHQLFDRYADIAVLCRSFGVRQLDVFGSAAVGGFDGVSSDYDFIAVFTPRPDTFLARRFLGFNEALEDLLGRRVDLMTDRRVANPYLRAAIDRSRQTLYVEPAYDTLMKNLPALADILAAELAKLPPP